jgi:ribosomal protein S28E/S33
MKAVSFRICGRTGATGSIFWLRVHLAKGVKYKGSVEINKPEEISV